MYPYPGFRKDDKIDPPVFFHFNCKHTGLLMCLCPQVPLNIQSAQSLSMLDYDLSSSMKFRKIEKERIERLPSYPVPPSKSHIKLDSQICDYCAKLVSNYQKVHMDEVHLNLCRDCYPADTQSKKSLSLSARKKKFGKLLDLGTTQSELARRGRPRLHSRDDDFIQCYYPKCLKRNLKINEDSDLLTCKKCTRTFHAGCADPPLKMNLVSRFPWYCLECKICCICFKLREESHVLICDACDRVFHSKCLKISNSGSFLCQDCGNCRNCAKNLPSPTEDANAIWVHGYRYCEECYFKVKESKYCPVCVKVYTEESDEAFIMCDHCQLWVHAACEKMTEDHVSAHEGKIFYCSRCQLELNKS